MEPTRLQTVHFLLGRHAALKGVRQDAKDFLRTVKPKHPQHEAAQQLLKSLAAESSFGLGLIDEERKQTISTWTEALSRERTRQINAQIDPCLSTKLAEVYSALENAVKNASALDD